MFSLQNRCEGIIDHARTILSQFVRLKNYPLFSFTEKLYGFAQFSLQDKVQKNSMKFLHSLCPTRFSEVPHRRVIRVFYKLVKHSKISQVKSKQNALSNLRGIFNALSALDNKGLKNDHPFGFPLPSKDPVKFYKKIPTNLFPTFHQYVRTM